MSDRSFALPAGAAFVAALLAFVSSCLERRDEGQPSSATARCASCHGDPKRTGDYLQRSAPPHDLAGSVDPSYPGVGAHLNHVYASETHGAVACSECHLVPKLVDSPGHADSPPPAEVVFGPIARTDGRAPEYDPLARRCSDSWCHRGADAVWTEPKSSAAACGSCHGLPPPAPHPQSERCAACHGQVVDEQRRFIAPELHVDGQVEVSPLGNCSACHGSADNPAPPKDTLGNTSVDAVGVGAHQVHLNGGRFSRPLACSECHVVPNSTDQPTHIDGLPAEVVLSGVVATADGHSPSWNRTALRCSDTYCHGPDANASTESPIWTSSTELGCTSCHGKPPPAPHPQITDCSSCHSAVIAADNVTIVDPSRHVNGVVDVVVPQACNTCHGGANPAPPVDLSGSSSTSSPGVGAHQTHLAGTPRSRAVPCAECHIVPTSVLAPGHLDTPPPAELTFSGAATAFGATPTYANGSCSGTPCHGAVFPNGDASGGTHTAPIWTKVDGSEAACGSCHSLPPPAPHPKANLNPICNACHENIAPDNLTFLRPDLHVDGIVTFTVP